VGPTGEAELAPHDLASIIDRPGFAGDMAGQGSEVEHRATFPQERVSDGWTRAVLVRANADDLATAINRESPALSGAREHSPSR
jgi:hypothetical protein